jgi:hypothetical protein
MEPWRTAMSHHDTPHVEQELALLLEEENCERLKAMARLSEIKQYVTRRWAFTGLM